MTGMHWVYIAYAMGIGMMLGYGAYIFLSIRHIRGRARGGSAGQTAVRVGDSPGHARHGDLEVKG